MARLRKAWLTIRRAIGFAMLQGAQHRSDPPSKTLQSLWFKIWVFDWKLSLGLGLPSSVPDSHASLVHLPDGDFSTWMFHLIGAIAGRINTRNHNIANIDYTGTTEIEQELLGLRDRMPSEWNLPNTDDMPLAKVFTKQVGKFHLNLLLKNLHFIYMVQDPTNNHGEAYPHSRTTAIQATQQVLEQYQGLRHSSQGALLICNIMDFHTFTGAIVLTTFEHLSLAMTCAVAKQAAGVLGYLYAAAHGFYHGEPYEVVILYFGGVQISPLVREQQEQQTTRSGSTTCISSHLDVLSPSLFSVIEFSAQTFCPQRPDTLGLGEGELGTDWSLFSGVEVDRDWNEVFTIPINGIH
ncbi:hypothetical protein BJX63DRAFT_437989 [Aspergillus granulosus]|uniref:Xylanolytic transcriptional activator regulatory domain-containing protein n=1 Tax=Aspergillus granulosus TaxID=176169 RepID=A0ABR4GTB4_9EURO